MTTTFGGGATRTLLRAAAVVAALAVVAGGVLGLLPWLARDSARESLEFPGVRRVDVDVAGDVQVVVEDAPVVRVERRSAWAFAAPRLEARVEGDALVVRARCGWPLGLACDLDHVLRVPAGTGGRVDSSAGDVRAADLAADVTLRSSAGEVVATGLRGARVDAQSSAGDVELSFAAPPEQARAVSSAGDVVVELPDDGAGYRVSASTSAGDTGIDVRQDPAASRSVEASSSAGDVRVRYARPR